jgi:predicted O-methyltransferase YrrM
MTVEVFARRRRKREAKRLRRWDVINRLLAGRKQPTSFLEIGAFGGECGAQIAAQRKVGVDPVLYEGVAGEYSAFYETTSDDFFALNEERFDLVFIDGYHTYQQALRDAQGALSCIKDGGFVVLHDSNPPNYDYQATPDLTGDVWKAVVALRRLSNFDTYTVAIETGVTIVRRADNPSPLRRAIEDYPALEAHRAEALRLVRPFEWLERTR